VLRPLGPTGAILLVALGATPPVEAAIEAILEGPVSRARRVELGATQAIVGVEVPQGIPLDDLPPEIENRFEVVTGLLAARRPEIDAVHLLVAHPGEPLAPPPVRLPNPDRRRVYGAKSDPTRFPFGQALAGRVVAISAGHGYIYYDSLGRYSTQRGNIQWNGCGSCRGIVEDFETHEIVVRHLIPLLEGAGARVIMVRDRAYASDGQIVDDGDASYTEGGTFSDGTSAGGHGDDYRVSDADGASATFSLIAPSSGRQHLSFWFVSGSNRYDAARLWVEADGVRRDYVLDLVTHGQRWAPITDLIVEAGTPVDVTLAAPATPSEGFLIADAVRLGSGTHSSGHPWWQMGAQPFAVYQNAPADVQSRGDVTARPRYAEYYGADIYVALHSNASGQPDSTAAGSVTYRYNCGTFPQHANDPPATDCDDPVGSDRLQELVHGSMVEAIEADWDTNWLDRGTKVANFGELRELDGIPGVLIESAFHDNVQLSGGSSLRVTDNQALHDPRWRRAAAFGIYRGITEYFSPGAPLVAPPPADVAVRRVDATRVEVSFTAAPNADAHRIYVATDGRVFDHGRIAMQSPAMLEDLTPESIVSVRVAAINAAGEGLPSRIVAARPSARRAQLLLVDAFEREDAWVQDVDNRHDTLFSHALALQSVEHAFDGVTEAALADVDLAAYDGVVVALGRESTEHGVLTAALRDRIRTASVAVFMSGSEIGWALDQRGDEESRAFLLDTFGARYAADDAGSATVQGASGWLTTPTAAIATAPGDALQVFSSDVLAPEPGAVAELLYDDGTSVAAVRSGNNVAMGVALDSVVDPTHRASILGGWATNAVELAPITPPRDGGVVADAGVVDGGAPDRDGGTVVRDAGTPDATPSPVPLGQVRALAEDPIRGSCGCQTRGGDMSGAWGLLLLLGLLARSDRDPRA
jgi:MYXO-CTERM domain-containing protein